VTAPRAPTPRRRVRHHRPPVAAAGRRTRRERGAALVELAFTGLMLSMIIFTTID
jgi:Flp pilus assembly protein TadG